ncbi:tyrosine-type recombinase/integrase [Croceicoccus gelatinilyticus]|uniref:tyrosine-type recombinase/integrase n=1 Tax=Croceicoccus gelatinilyticus TaxID=2835536 RepID=UPI001BCE3B07|nr:site-specific integrase [Croceicoccus gelatinilyticus]MBS7671494.1 tyrosine-type recombinase/integrase [Croceicoccus gelatinilyticus]
MGKLTAMGVKNLTEPGRYSDGEGLILKLAAKGKGSWIVRIQADGKRRDFGLGPLSELPLADAREAARALRKEVKAGVDVLAEREKEALVIPTFSDAAKLVHEEHKAAWKNGKHQAQWIKTLETYAFPTLGDKLVSDIEGPAIRDALSPIWLTKPETARRVRQRIGSVLDWACAKGFRETEAPMRSVLRGLPRQPKKQGHLSAMPYQELPAFFTWLRGRSSVGRLALEFVILNASRSGEVRGASWNEIDLKKKLWTIPAERMKAGTAHVVPLSEAALDVLKRAKAFRSPVSDLIFPGQNPRRYLSDMTLLKILRDKGHDYTVHGFRSSFRDWVAEKTNYPGEVAEAALAHTITNKVEAAYRRTDYLGKRKPMMADWANFVAG